MIHEPANRGDAFKTLRQQNLVDAANANHDLMPVGDGVESMTVGRGRGFRVVRPRLHIPANVVMIRNDSTLDLEDCAILGISGVAGSPADDLPEFKRQAIFTGDIPLEASHVGKFVVLLQAIANGAVGPAYISGICPVQINIADADHIFADIEDNDTSALVSRNDGSARILFAESGTGLKWAYVLLTGVPGDLTCAVE